MADVTIPQVSSLRFATGQELHLPDATFATFQSMVYREAGIWLNESKKALLMCRLAKRLRELGAPTFEQYYRMVKSDEAERALFFDLITTNETHFFREPRQFEFLQNTIIPEWKQAVANARRTKTISIWSAGCSSGEEPYSILMLLLEHLPVQEGWTIRIHATDISTRVLERAQQGVWRIERAKEIPESLLKKYMQKGVGQSEGTMRARPELRSMLNFRRLNLNDSDYGMPHKFDLIFCRNVLIYFNLESKTQVLNRLFRNLAPGGKLFLGHAENLAGFADRNCGVASNIYRNPLEQDGSRSAKDEDAA